MKSNTKKVQTYTITFDIILPVKPNPPSQQTPLPGFGDYPESLDSSLRGIFLLDPWLPARI
jgi:hypothetical protein